MRAPGDLGCGQCLRGQAGAFAQRAVDQFQPGAGQQPLVRDMRKLREAVAEDGEIAKAGAELAAVYMTHFRSGLNDLFFAVNRAAGVLEAFADEVVGLGRISPPFALNGVPVAAAFE